ncbi:MAG: urea ABC transporter ATP-binding subunit UrtE [Gammaproteobacteria bacterium]|nr:urea ABC transporter ATP-binding subunit UrtE [Gammaproteobacteria bacterium]
MLKIEKLNQFYGESHTLWDIDLEVEKGECLCLMGRNGVGKTTLLKSLMGLIPVKDGSIKFNNTEILRKDASARASIGVGYVPQGREIFPQLTVEENLKIGLTIRGAKNKTVPDRIYELFPVLKEMLHRRGGDLSGGQQQQLAIGRALVLNPEILILDEPTEGIQPNVVHDIGSIIKRLNKEENLTVLLVEQKLPFARRLGDRFVILDRGRKVSEGKMTALSEEIVKEYLVV